MRYLCESYILNIKLEQQTKMNLFLKSVRIWVKGRDKHERLLRPRLGSPDAVLELEQLDAIELQRSSEMLNGILFYRKSVLKRILEFSMIYIEDITKCSKSLLLYTDTSLTQDVIKVPPDTAIPKVRMTLKRLRKAERVKNALDKGQEDNTQMRIWDGINMEQFNEFVLLLTNILNSNTTTNSNSNETNTESELPNVIEFVTNIVKQSSVRAMVSTAHRSLINERNRAIQSYLNTIIEVVHEYSDDFSLFLQQERSWNERWQRQVNMLRGGNI